MIRKLAITATFALLAACGGDDTNNTNNTNNSNVAFATVFSSVIQPSCSCHLSATGSGGLAMPDAASAYAALVEQPASSGGPCDGETLVVSGDAASSVIYRKVTGTNLCGQKMPMGGADLSQDKIDILEAWIAAGALE